MPPGDPEGDGTVRFLDILTTASALARSHGAESVAAADMLEAIAVLTGESPPEEAAAPVSPLGHQRGELTVEPAVRELTQRWFARLGSSPEATLGADHLSELRTECEALLRS